MIGSFIKSRVGKRIAIIAIGLLLPLSVYATTLPFLVSITIRSGSQIVVSAVEDMTMVKETLNITGWRAISVSNLSFGEGVENIPILRFSESRVVAFNANGEQVTVTTFTTPVGESGARQFLIGGYIPESGPDLDGVYVGSTVLDAVYQ